MIHFQPAPLAGGVDRGHRVERHALGVEMLDAAEDFLESGRAALVAAEAVVDVLRAIQRDAQQEVIFFEKARPLARDECAVGLQAVVDLFAICVDLLELHRPAVEVEAHHQRLAAVPDELHLRDVVGGDVVADDALEHRVAHPGLAAAVDLRLVEVVAVGAVEVAQGARGLQHDVERPRSLQPQGIAEGQRILERVRHGRLFRDERLEVFPDAVEPGVAAGARGGRALEAVAAQREGVELALDAHRAHLFPGLDGIHRGVGVGVAVDEEHRGGVEVEGELRREDG